MPIKPTPAERASANSGTPLNREGIAIRNRMGRISRLLSLELQHLDTMIVRAGGLANVQGDLGALAADFDNAYDKLKEAVEAIDPSASVPARGRDRAAEVAANKRQGIP